MNEPDDRIERYSQMLVRCEDDRDQFKAIVDLACAEYEAATRLVETGVDRSEWEDAKRALLMAVAAEVSRRARPDSR